MRWGTSHRTGFSFQPKVDRRQGSPEATAEVRVVPPLPTTGSQPIPAWPAVLLIVVGMLLVASRQPQIRNRKKIEE